MSGLEEIKLMKISLTDWIQKQPEIEQIPDVLAQLLAFSREDYGVMNPDSFSLEFEEDSQKFGTLAVEEKAQNFAENVYPVKILNNESDDMFVIGLLLYQMLGCKIPDLRRAKLMLAQAEGNQEVPLLSLANSSLNPLLEKLSDINSNTRISKSDALDWLAKSFPAIAVVKIVERETMVELQKLEVPLFSGVTTWKPSSTLEYSGYQFYPEQSEEYHFPFRQKTVEYICYVRAVRESVSDIVSICPELGKLCFGLDFGAFRTRVSRLESSGKMRELSEIPSVIAYKEQGVCVYGETAIQLHTNQNADLIHCFQSIQDLDVSFTVMASDGTMVQETKHSAMLKFMKYIYHIITDRLKYRKDTCCAVLTLPSSTNANIRQAFQKLAEKAGFSVYLLSSAVASVIFQSMYEHFQGNLMVIDSGAGVTDICLLRYTEQKENQIPDYAKGWTDGISAKGGDAMTEAVYNSILQTLSTQYALSMYQWQNSGLNPAQFAENVKQIQEQSAHIKHTLSFSNKSSSAFELYANQLGKKKIQIGFTGSQYQTLLTPITNEIQGAIRQVLAGRNVPPSQVQTVLLTGGASLTPAIRHSIEKFFGKEKVQYLNYTMSPVRGAALFAGMLSHEGESAVQLTEFPEDLGIITADAIHGTPVFQCIVPAGTKLENDAVSFEYSLIVSESDLDKEKYCNLRIYVRPRGMEHIKSTLVPMGDSIRCIGIICVPLPPKYVMKSDKLVFRVEVDVQENVSVRVSHYRKSVSPFGKFIGLIKQNEEEQWKPLEVSIDAECLSPSE